MRIDWIPRFSHCLFFAIAATLIGVIAKLWKKRNAVPMKSESDSIYEWAEKRGLVIHQFPPLKSRAKNLEEITRLSEGVFTLRASPLCAPHTITKVYAFNFGKTVIRCAELERLDRALHG